MDYDNFLTHDDLDNQLAWEESVAYDDTDLGDLTVEYFLQ